MQKNIDIQPPVALFNVFPKTGNTVTEFQFDGSETIIEGDDKELFYRWDWEGDSIWDLPFSINPKTTHQYTRKGTFYPVLEVKNKTGLTDRINFELIVEQGNSPPRPSFTIDKYLGNIISVFSFDARMTKDDEDIMNKLKFRWDWESDGQWDTDYLTSPTINHIFRDTGVFYTNMEVIDPVGLTAQFSKKVTINLINKKLIVDYTIAPDSGTTDDVFIFDGTPCSDPDNFDMKFEYCWSLWDENDILIEDSGFYPEKIFNSEFGETEFGKKKLKLTIKDEYGLMNSVTKFFTVLRNNNFPSSGFWVVPKRGNIYTDFYFDSENLCSDPEEDWWDLNYRWDFDNDGTWDTPYDRRNRVINYQYSSPGDYTAVLEVMDIGGLTDTTHYPITVSNGTNETGVIIHKLGSPEEPVWQYYGTVKIGNQWWMSENLNINSQGLHSNPSIVEGRWCYNYCFKFSSFGTGAYENNDLYRETYGGLYLMEGLLTFKYVKAGYNTIRCLDRRGELIICPEITIQACPEGWHVSTTDDWNQLLDYLGPGAADKLKPGGSTDFNAFYGGKSRYINDYYPAEFYGLEEFGSFAAMDFSRIFNNPNTDIFQIFKNDSEVLRNSSLIREYNSIRCVKDN